MGISVLRSVFAGSVFAGLLLSAAAGQEKAGSVAHIDKFVETWQPAPEERRFDDIGWAKDVPTARKLSQDNGRPLFLFTHDGHIHIGRC